MAINAAGSTEPEKIRSRDPRDQGASAVRKAMYNFDENGDGLHGYNVVKQRERQNRVRQARRLPGLIPWSCSFSCCSPGWAVGSIYALVSLGFVLLIRAASVVNFAQGEFSMLGAYLMVIFANDLGVPYYLAIPISIGLMAAFGVMFAGAVYWPLRHRGQLPVIISTIGASILVVQFRAGRLWPEPAGVAGLVRHAWLRRRRRVHG